MIDCCWRPYLLSLVALAACSNGSDPTDGATSTGGTDGGGASSSSGSTASLSSSTTTTGGGGEGEGGQAPDQPCPGWPGWLTWDDFAAGQPFCWAPDPETLVAPVEWEPCPPLSGFKSGCRQMKITWPYDFSPIPSLVTVSVEPDGTPIIDFFRNSLVSPNGHRMWLIAEADGPVRAAFLDVRQFAYGWVNFSSFSRRGSSNGYYAGALSHEEEGHPEAVIGGQWDDKRPSVQHVFPDSKGHAVAASGALWGTWNSRQIEIALWGSPPETVWDIAVQGGYQQTMLVPFEDFATWQNGDANYSSLMAWTPEQGAYPFIEFGADPTQGAHGLGTDGVDMAWVQSEGRVRGYGPYPIRHIMTSPFTRDPSELEPRRLRSFPSEAAVIGPVAVGCGYVGHGYEPGKVILVRLEDGASWHLPSSGCHIPNVTDDFCFEDVYAITCEEMFVRGGIDGNITRVEIAALGEPTPPD